MKQAIINVIENYEPRANIIDILVEDRIDLNAIAITVAFEVINDPDAVVLDVILEKEYDNMSANTYLRVTEVDFADIKTNLKAYLRSQTQFNDYDFDGSNMSTLLDVLAYNTHYNAFYTNMLANEMFLDTAQQRDSVVSRAKELGYLTRSARGASANVSITFAGVASNVSEFELPKNTSFTTSINNRTFTFVTPESNIIRNVGGAFTKAITITEGCNS